jgi:hypothetical protein
MPAPQRQPSIPTGTRDREKILEHVKLPDMIPNAYALVPVKGKIDQFYAVRLVNVTAQYMDHLEPNEEAERGNSALKRIVEAATKRWRKHAWGSNER